jgi:PKD repeat protein
VSFNASSSSAPSNDWISSYIWSFGDGTMAAGVRASHAFRAGNHTVMLTVFDAFGQAASVSHLLTISDEAPSVSFRTLAGRGKTIAFRAQASDPDGRIVSYRWRFGDRTRGRGRKSSHTYSRAGRYTVTLIVTDSSGTTMTVTRRITVGASRARHR